MSRKSAKSKAGAKADGKMKRGAYEEELHKLQVELCHLQAWVRATGARVIILFEGAVIYFDVVPAESGLHSTYAQAVRSAAGPTVQNEHIPTSS